MMAKTALVTGASSGIGRMVAQKLKNAGFQVYAAARRVDRMADLEKDGIAPLSATAKQPMKHPAYIDFIGKPIVVGSKNSLVFSKKDALVPFISRNESMWEFFEPELRRRLSMMETDDSYAARVRSALMELLAKTYLANTDMTAEDIAFLLGYQEIGSFLRAFTAWTGQTVSEYKENVQRQPSV